MKTKIYLLIIILLVSFRLEAQQFLTKAVIEYEVKTDIKKTMSDDAWSAMLKDKMPQFNTGYFTFTFADNKSIYKFDHWEQAKIPSFMRSPDEENVWFYDYNKGIYDKQKNIYGSNFNIHDSIPQLNWKITNDTRVIAGFNCRKAVAIIFDSVYVFAFYTDEIMISGGPESINGLPGMILGVTIPRLYTSWIATKVMISNVDQSIIKPVPAKKSYDMKDFTAMLNDRTKDFYYGDDDNGDAKRMKAMFLWNSFL